MKRRVNFFYCTKKKRLYTKLVMILRKIVGYAGTVLFSAFSYLQVNDVTQYDSARPIQVSWLIGYLVLAILSFLTATRPFIKAEAYLLLAAGQLVAVILRFQSIDWEYKGTICNPNNPAANETGGLLIGFIWLIVLYLVNRKKCSPS